VVQHLGQAGEYRDKTIKFRLMTWLLESADLVTALDETEIKNLKRAGFPAHKLFHLPDHGVDTNQFYPTSKKAAADELNRSEECTYIVYVGRVTSIKNVPALVDAFDDVKRADDSAKLIVIGGGTRKEISKVEDIVAEYGLTDSVELVGHVPHAQLPVYYNLADLCVFPSESEGLGLVLIEAGACETPIIGTRAHSSDIYVHNDTVYKIDDITPDSISDAVLELLNDEALRNTLATNIRQGIKDTHSFEQVKPRIIEAYQTALGNHVK